MLVTTSPIESPTLDPKAKSPSAPNQLASMLVNFETMPQSKRHWMKVASSNEQNLPIMEISDFNGDREAAFVKRTALYSPSPTAAKEVQ